MTRNDTMSGEWRIAKAVYDPAVNAVRETRIASFDDCDKCLAYLNGRATQPLMAYHKDCMRLDNPSLASVATDAYRAEYNKITD